MHYDLITSNLIEELRKLNRLTQIEVKSFKNGDFGDLKEIDFKISNYLGHISIWSSGIIFYNLIDDNKNEDYELIEEKSVDYSNIGEEQLNIELNKLIKNLKQFIV